MGEGKLSPILGDAKQFHFQMPDRAERGEGNNMTLHMTSGTVGYDHNARTI